MVIFLCKCDIMKAHVGFDSTEKYYIQEQIFSTTEKNSKSFKLYSLENKYILQILGYCYS